MLSIYLTPIVLIATNIINHPAWVIIMYIVSGIGMAGVGMGIMHDANHGTLSSKSKLNKLYGKTLDLVGCSSEVWKMQHNVLHHTYTNIDDHDEDIDTPIFLSFSPNTKKYWIHRFQHLYAWFFYGLSTLHWVTAKDFIALKKYRQIGLVRDKSTHRKEIWKSIYWKLIYYSYILVLPMIFNSAGVIWIVVGFLSMHFVTGLLVSTIFQLAHVMPDMSFPQVNTNNEIESNWYVHQLETTSNFSPKSAWFSWLIGGLNYQIEHHLFPNISHIHYRKISVIISETAKEYGLPYYVNKSFFGAIWKHLKMLRTVGKMRNAINY
jgi:linoleoyl-CoA desaturase